MQHKKWFSYLMAIAVVIVSVIMVPSTVGAKDKETVKITILGTSDVHGRFVPWDYALDIPQTSGSLTQLYTAIKQIRQENHNTILVDAGDSIQDNSVELFKNSPKNPMVEAMNIMGYDTWTMGNHEFNFGLEVLRKTTSNFKGQTLAGNIYYQNGKRFMPAYTIVERGGIKIGIIGMTTPLITQFEAGTDNLKGLVVNDPVVETKKSITELQGKVDAIVGVIHMGEDNENSISNTGVRDIANACPELSAIVAGHMHKLIQSNTINNVLITEPYRYGTSLSRIELDFTKDGDRWIVSDKKADVINMTDAKQNVLYPSDAQLEKKLAPFHESARADANKVIGQLTAINLVPKNEIKGIPAVQVMETPLTDLFNEVQLYYSKADVVAISLDNDNAHLDIGPIKKKEIFYNYRYAGGETTVYQITGKDLKVYMEWAAGYFNSVYPGDATISFDPKRRASKYSTNDIFGGVKYIIDLTKPQGSRITNLTHLDGTPIVENEILKLGMNSYRMDQLQVSGGIFAGKNFPKLWSSKEELGADDGVIRNMAINYINVIKKGVLAPKLLNNWKIIGIDVDSQQQQALIALINADLISIPKTADGKYTNIAAINLLAPVTATEINDLCAKAKVDASLFQIGMNKGDFYSKVNELRKL